MTHVEMQQALAVLHLPERATLREIKNRYRQLAKRHHPDHGAAETDQIRHINAAYRLAAEAR